MLSYAERLKKLQDFDLTEYQARTYLALLELGTATASKIPAISRVPRTKVYSIMRQLHERGLVHIIPESPLRYRPVPFRKYLEKQIQELRDEAESLESVTDDLAAEFEIIAREPDEHGSFEAFYGRRAVRDKIREMYNDAKEKIVLIGTAMSPPRIVHNTLPIIRDKIENEVDIYFAFPITEENRDSVDRFYDLVTVRHLEREPPMHFIVVDEKEALLIHRVPDDENPIKGDDAAIWTDDSAVVAMMGEVASQILDQSLGYDLSNTFRPLIFTATRWASALGMDPKKTLEVLAENIASHIIKHLSAATEDALFEELKAYWKAEHLGTFYVVNRDPLVLGLDNGLGKWCRETNGDIICHFFKRIVEKILTTRLGTVYVVIDVRCPRPSHEYCSYTLQTKEEEEVEEAGEEALLKPEHEEETETTVAGSQP